MRLRIKFVFFLLLCSAYVSAQKVDVTILPPSISYNQDSTVINVNMSVRAIEMDSKATVCLTPLIINGRHVKELPEILLNGERAQRLYGRNKDSKKYRHNTHPFKVMEVTKKAQLVDYRVAVPSSSWMHGAKISIRQEDVKDNGEHINAHILPAPAPTTRASEASYQAPKATPDYSSLQRNTSAPVQAVSAVPSYQSPAVSSYEPAQTSYSAPRASMRFKGSYISPEIDATDERNQKELKFNLEEARVIAGVNPRMLSLRELYTVAISYKNNPPQFYKIIDMSVKIYPANPIANLNAAAAAIERGNIEDAGRYLQMASRESLAYKNCKGAYELLCNNTYEGIRLLKAAKEEGSEEAAYNLKLFFDTNRNSL